jgi:hypothetical protein
VKTSPLAEKLAAVAPKLKIAVSTADGDSVNYDAEQSKSLKRQIKALEAEAKNWNAEAVSAAALKKLKAEIARKKAALMEID